MDILAESVSPTAARETHFAKPKNRITLQIKRSAFGVEISGALADQHEIVFGNEKL